MGPVNRAVVQGQARAEAPTSAARNSPPQTPRTPARGAAAGHCATGTGGHHQHDDFAVDAETWELNAMAMAMHPLMGLPTPAAATSRRHTSEALADKALLQLFAHANALRQSNQVADAFELLRNALNSSVYSRHQRAAVALAMAQIARGLDRDGTRAQLFYLQALTLDPRVPAAARVRAMLLADRGEVSEALASARQALAEQPDDVPMLRLTATLLRADAQPAEAAAQLQRALAIAEAASDTRVSDLNNMRVQLAVCLRSMRQVHSANDLARQVLQADPNHRGAHGVLSQTTLPNFAAANRTAIENLFSAANEAYRLGDHREMGRLALAILQLDPNDGLAHSMYVASAEAAARNGPLIDRLDTEHEQQALVRHLVAIAARARVGTPPRPGLVTDLFPQWNSLSPLQQATVAHGVLGYGRLIPLVLEMGAEFHFVTPGTSGTTADPERGLQDIMGSQGRTFYAMRGWQRDTFTVVGTERIDQAAYGGYDTVAHEFAHQVHRLMKRAADRAQELGRAALADDELFLADAFTATERLYDQAHSRHDNQVFLDDYSSNNEYEYFAQGMMAYLNPHGAGKQNAQALFGRNPNLFALVQQIAGRFGDFPLEVPAWEHLPLGQDASPSLMTLHALRSGAELSGVRQRAAAAFRHVEALYNPPAPPHSLAHLADLPEAERHSIGDHILQRAAELAAIDHGKYPINYLGTPWVSLALMSDNELLAQLHAEEQRLEEILPAIRVPAIRQRLLDLRDELRTLRQRAPANSSQVRSDAVRIHALLHDENIWNLAQHVSLAGAPTSLVDQMFALAVQRAAGTENQHRLAGALLDQMQALYVSPPRARAPTVLPMQPSLPERYVHGPLQYEPARAISESARAGKFGATLEAAQALQSEALEKLSERQLREIVSALSEALQAAEEGGKWLVRQELLRILVLILTFGQVDLYLKQREKAALWRLAAAPTESLRRRQRWMDTGREYARRGGPELANFRALNGDAALLAHSLEGLSRLDPNCSEAERQDMQQWFYRGILEADRLAESSQPSMHFQTIPLSSEERLQAATRLAEMGEIATSGSLRPIHVQHLGLPALRVILAALHEQGAGAEQEALTALRHLGEARLKPASEWSAILTEFRRTVGQLLH